MKYLLSKFDESIKAQDLGDTTLSVNGLFVVTTPSGVQIDNPTTYADLKTQKQDGIKALYLDFTDIVADEFDNDSNLDYTQTDFNGCVGKYEVLLRGNGGRAYTTSQALGYAPGQIVVYWDSYEMSRATNALKGKDLTWTEDVPSSIGVEVSFDLGLNYDPVTYGTVFIPATPTADLRLRFTRTGPGDRYLGYFVVLYRA